MLALAPYPSDARIKRIDESKKLPTALLVYDMVEPLHRIQNDCIGWFTERYVALALSNSELSPRIMSGSRTSGINVDNFKRLF